MQKHKQIVQKIRDMVCHVSPKKQGSLNHSSSDYTQQLEAEVQSYMQKEESLLKIIESLSSQNKNRNHQTVSRPQSSEEED